MKNIEDKNMLYCTGCGLCESVCSVGAIAIKECNGFLRPFVDENQCVSCGKCIKYCPGLQKDNANCSYQSFDNIVYGHSMTDTIRKEAASGGITTELIRYVLENSMVDYVVTSAEYHNDKSLGYKIITKENIDDVYNLAGSNYCPANIGKALEEIRGRKGCCLLICLPCLARGIRRLQEADIVLRERIKYIVCLLCNHVPSYNATSYLLKKYDMGNPDIVKYRGNGWFGFFRTYSIENTGERNIIKEIPYSQYFSTGFSKYFWQSSCLACNDHFGRYADICMGDADFIKYRDEKVDNPGETICFIKNIELLKILKQMKDQGHIYLKTDISENELSLIYEPLTIKLGKTENLRNNCEQILKMERRTTILDKIRESRLLGIIRSVRSS